MVEGRQTLSRVFAGRTTWLPWVMFGCCHRTFRFITPGSYVALGHDAMRTEGFSPRGRVRGRARADYVCVCVCEVKEEDDTVESLSLAWRDAQVFNAINLDHKQRFTATSIRVLRVSLRSEREKGRGGGERVCLNST